MLPIRTIVYPTDFSERSGYAFQVACALARDYGARLFVLHVKTPPLVVYGEGPFLPPEPTVASQALHEKLDRLVPPDPKVWVEHLMTEGDPATEILRLAEESKCDLIVMGTHGRTGLRRLLMGSVAEQVVRKAPCPVFTLKTPFPPAAPVEAPAPEELVSV